MDETQSERKNNTEAMMIIFKAQLTKNSELGKMVVNLCDQESRNTVTTAKGNTDGFAEQKASERSGLLAKALAKPCKSGAKAREQEEDKRQGAVKTM